MFNQQASISTKILERKKKQDACGCAEHVEDELFAVVDGAVFGADLELLAVPVVCRVRDGS